ncbi:MAG: hypothetical protein IJ175_05575 [Clostridia bacterium]|nr:hypothetical protein [Clostridia bacterium]
MVTARGWSALVLSLSFLLLLLCALAVYLLDPFEHYRESAILPLYDQESYNNPGIARNYDYDAVILGTSMVEMSSPSVIDGAFGVRSVKLPMRGSHTAQMGWQLSHILEKRPLSLAILAVDAYSLMGPPDDDEEIVEYLWNDAALDDVNYLLNRDVLLVKLPRLLRNRGLPLEGKRDAMYQWVDVTFSEKSVLETVTFRPQQEMTPADARLERSTENIRRNLIPSIEAHPETRFCIYMPPYSAAYWYQVTRGGLSEQQYRTRRLVCEMLLGYPNVEVYDFSCRLDWIENLNNYFDYSHHSRQVSDALIAAMARGENRVQTAAEMEAGSEALRKAAQAFADRYEP